VSLLFLTHRLPYAPNRGDRIRTFYILRTLATRWPVHVLSLVHDREEASHVHDLDGLAASVTTVHLPWLSNHIRALKTLLTDPNTPLTLVLLDSPTLRTTLHQAIDRVKPQLLLASSSGMGALALEGTAASVPLVVDLIDADSEKWAALAKSRAWLAPIYAREARALRTIESKVIAHSFGSCVVNEREREALVQHGPEKVHVVPLGVDVDDHQPRDPPSAARTVIFSGVMNYRPNVDAALWLLEEIWPQVLAAVPDAMLEIVGARPTRILRSRAALSRQTMVTGAVPDVRPYLWSGSVSVAPLRFARGLQTKVLQAVAAGLPTVVTPVVAAGLPEAVLPACRIAETAAEFAGAVVDLLHLTPDARRVLASSADLTSLRFESLLQPLIRLIDAAMMGSRTTTRRRRR
jgi:sugar transferase (PEP-CTERM/EpsH1 system associated)